MLFNSLHFLVFFPAVVAVYFLLPHRWRWLWLLAASCYFYMAFIPVYILILFFTIIIDYIAGQLIERSVGKRRKFFLVMSIVANVGVLAIFKYYNFTATNLTELAHFLHWNYSVPLLSIILPIGLSFHTFQAMSYTIEIYRGNCKAERHFGIYALYVMFFPQLVAGPIERPQNLLHQFYEKHVVDLSRIASGFRRMLWGFFKKIVIADTIAVIVSHVYNYPMQFKGLPLVVATVLFAVQLYADFSGYSDIAVGSARILGFRLMENFNRPYSATSIAEFWKRWHISLTSWFRDYIYIPLGRNHATPFRLYASTLFVFLLSGLWHGANWTFIIWGGCHGVFLVVSLVTRNVRRTLGQRLRLQSIPKLHSLFRVLYTFSLVCLSFIFFRATTVQNAWYIVTHLFSASGNGAGLSIVDRAVMLTQSLGTSNFVLVQIVIAALVMKLVEGIGNQDTVDGRVAKLSPWVRWSMYNALILWIIFFGYFGEQPFIYFQF